MFPRYPKGTQSILYCLLVETNQGLLLVDTGFGIQDHLHPTLLTKLFIRSLGMPRSIEETAFRQIESIGFSAKDVSHIVLTHMHNDHAGGLRDFPNALVHVHKREYEAIQSPKGIKERFYDPAQWSHNPHWVIHEKEEADDWFGFRNIRINKDLKPDIRLIPLTGHSRGHCGVAVQTASGWLLHCGDATYPFYQKNDPVPPYKPLPNYVMNPPHWLEKNLIGENTPRLKELVQNFGDQVQLICSNDIISFSKQKN